MNTIMLDTNKAQLESLKVMIADKMTAQLTMVEAGDYPGFSKEEQSCIFSHPQDRLMTRHVAGIEPAVLMEHFDDDDNTLVLYRTYSMVGWRAALGLYKPPRNGLGTSTCVTMKPKRLLDVILGNPDDGDISADRLEQLKLVIKAFDDFVTGK